MRSRKKNSLYLLPRLVGTCTISYQEKREGNEKNRVKTNILVSIMVPYSQPLLFEIWRELAPQNFFVDSFWDLAGTASTEFFCGFFLRFGGNCLHRFFLWILFEIWRELAPQNFFADSFWDSAGTASTEFWGGFFLRFGGNCLHRIFLGFLLYPPNFPINLVYYSLEIVNWRESWVRYFSKWIFMLWFS